MNISPETDNINFQSKINFVSAKEFKSKHCKHLLYCKPPTAPVESSFMKESGFWTYEVKSCTAGGIVDKNGVLGFHILDCAENIRKLKQNMQDIIKNLNHNNLSALVIGAKDLPDSQYSIPMFDTVSEIIKKVIKPSVFKRHTNIYAQTDLKYDSQTDTWMIATLIPEIPMLPYGKTKSITDIHTLLENFGSVNIAPQDRLFINGREITKEVCPEIFTHQ